MTGKGLIKKLKEGVEARSVETETYIDLTTLDYEGDVGEGGASVKVAELRKYEDLMEITNQVYGGNIVLIDFSPIGTDDLLLKRVTSELKSVARDMNGDVAGVGKNFLIVTPTGIKVDRKVIKGGF